MEYVDGEPIETLATAPRETREPAAVPLTELALRELFDWRLMQTDSNFANFCYRAADDEIVLLDFGATRRFDPALVEAFRTPVDASLGDSERDLERAAMDVVYLAPEDAPAARRAVVDLVSIAAEPARFPGAYGFRCLGPERAPQPACDGHAYRARLRPSAASRRCYTFTASWGVSTCC